MKVIDDFLDKKDFSKMEEFLLSTVFPWYLAHGKSFKNDGNYQFIHSFVEYNKVLSKFSELNFPILRKLNVGKIIRIKANLTFKKETNKEAPMHVDHKFKDNTKFKTAVFYLNSNNGSTLFQNGKRIYSKANRFLIFDGHQKHCGVDCTDQDYRIVINYNWIEKNS
tara:strand:+ start:158 stop:655 length:498 start_codon:yes stop_codon:yes gene_type:complete